MLLSLRLKTLIQAPDATVRESAVGRHEPFKPK